jgi:hypothetical protein
MTDFELLLKKGQVGEQVALRYFSKLTEVKDRTDYTQHKFYQKKGFDFEFLNRKTQTWDRAEVKTNIRENNLTFFELYNKNAELGWFNTSTADILVLFSVYSKKLYYCNLKEMRNYINSRIKSKSINYSTVKDGSVGVWIPVNKNNLIIELD